MATVNLISALKLMRQFGDSEATVSVITATIEELERLQELEQHAIELAVSAHSTSSGCTTEEVFNYAAAERILKLASVEKRQPVSALERYGVKG